MSKRPNPELIDDDAPEWTAEDMARAHPARDALPGIVGEKLAAQMLAPKRRGPGRKPRKVLTTIRLDADTLARWKATGPGWQTRMAQRLAKP